MRIERLMPPKTVGRPWLLTLEDGSLHQVFEGEIIDFALYTGMELEEPVLKRLKAAGEKAALRDRAVSLLISRPYSKGELVGKLQGKGAAESLAWEVADWAEEVGLLNEEGYAKSLVRHYSAKGYGIYKVKDVLYQRKIPKDLWEVALTELVAPEEAIDEYLRRSLRSTEPKAIKRAADHLARRGFSWGQVSEGLERFRLEEE